MLQVASFVYVCYIHIQSQITVLNDLVRALKSVLFLLINQYLKNEASIGEAGCLKLLMHQKSIPLV